MSNGEKDKLGEKLHDIEAARENEWARKRDQELLEKMRHAKHDGEAAHSQEQQPAICPECKHELVPNPDQHVGGMICPQRHGGWFGWDTVARIMGEFAHTKK
jgi:predicted Zn-ribbon and HTH transcriptional regulator